MRKIERPHQRPIIAQSHFRARCDLPFDKLGIVDRGDVGGGERGAPTVVTGVDRAERPANRADNPLRRPAENLRESLASSAAVDEIVKIVPSQSEKGFRIAEGEANNFGD